MRYSVFSTDACNAQGQPQQRMFEFTTLMTHELGHISGYIGSYLKFGQTEISNKDYFQHAYFLYAQLKTTTLQQIQYFKYHFLKINSLIFCYIIANAKKVFFSMSF